MTDDFFIDGEGYVVVADPQHGCGVRIRKATQQDHEEYAAHHQGTTKVLLDYIETLPGIVEEIADRLGLYGYCGDFKCYPHPSGGFYCCRTAFVSSILERIEEAHRIRDILDNNNRLQEMLEWFSNNQAQHKMDP